MSTKATQKQHIKLASLKALQAKARLAVYDDVIESGSLGFLDCFKLAHPIVKQAYYDTQDARATFENELINRGKAWRDSLNQLVLN